MKKTYRLIARSLILMISLSVPSYGWNNRGHMMVAGVAYKKLTKKTRDRVDALLLLNPDRENWFELIPEGTSIARTNMMLFMIAATWPDRIKGHPDYFSDGTGGGNIPPTDGTADRNTGYDDFARHKYWHFVDIPFSLDGTTLPEIITPNAMDRIDAFRAVLASDASDELKSYDLSWLLHVIGDVHQPLHCLARITASKPKGDDGGNAVKLTSPANLHSFWDGVIGRGDTPATAINALSSVPAPNVSQANNVTTKDWIDESFNMRSFIYKNPPIGPGTGPFTLDADYRAKAKTRALRRIALAGARLAKILNNELK